MEMSPIQIARRVALSRVRGLKLVAEEEIKEEGGRTLTSAWIETVGYSIR